MVDQNVLIVEVKLHLKPKYCLSNPKQKDDKMNKQYRYKVKSWFICPYLKIYNDMGFSNGGKPDPKTGSIYTEPRISQAECTCQKSRCPYDRKCIVAKVRY